MTTLDDALNSSSVVFDTPDLKAEWREMPPNEKFGTNADTVRDLSQQMNGDFTVDHSLDDALPDPVTMTTGNDASGSMTAALLGREQTTGDIVGWRGTTTGAGGGTIAACTVPADVQPGDYVIVSITVDSNVMTMTDSNASPGNQYAWKLLGSINDGATLKTWVWGRMFYLGSGGPQLTFTSSQSYTWESTAFYSSTADGRVVPMRPNAFVGLGETVSGTSHATAPVTLANPGYIVSIWGTTSGTWTPPAGSTELVDTGIGPVQMIAVTSMVQQAGTYTLTATSSITTAVATKIAIGLEIKGRRRMDAMSYFSPLNKESPIYGWDRDTAAVTFIYNVLTAIGSEGTTLFTGQMADIGVSGRTAELQAVSQTRLEMDRSVTPPLVRGDRENCTVDWYVTWLMARGGMYAGPVPGSLTRYWAPMYGSAHAHLQGKYSYSGALWYSSTSTPAGPYGLKPPSALDGPFLTAMYAQQSATRTEEIFLNIGDLLESNDTFPAIGFNTDVNLYKYDQMSQASSSGRITMWLRGDSVVNAPAYMTGLGSFIFYYRLVAYDSAGNQLAFFEVYLSTSSRRFVCTMGNTALGNQAFTLSASVVLPTDGEWHFVGFAWDWKNGLARMKIDANEAVTSSYTLTQDSALPLTDATLRAAGGRIDNNASFRVPVSDFQIEFGGPAYGNPWTRHYPIPEGSNAIIRPTRQNMQAITEVTPSQAWTTLAELARASLSAYRTNEEDNFEFLPLSYFGETAQMTPVGVVDTDLNASELNVKQDASKTRNVVTVEFDETRVNSTLSSVFELTSSIELVRGTSSIVFSLDDPMAELHLQASPNTPLTNLTSAQVAAPTTIPSNIHYMSVNTAQDGSGSVLSVSSVSATITDFTASTITVTFINKITSSAWLSNNGSDVPFLRLLGYPTRVTKGYVTARDTGSVTTRKERPLTIQLPWVQDRVTATNVAKLLVNILARPRAEVSLRVMGDPRRRPGQLVTIDDSEGTQAQGAWRILSISHNGSGPEYTQDLSLVQVLPVAVWDGLDGWDYSVWGE